MPKTCIRPFQDIEIGERGKIYTCCPFFINYHEIGNLFSEGSISFEDIWHSEKAKKIRQSVIDGTYSYCNIEACRNREIQEIDEKTINNPIPKRIIFSYDKECNLRCITCRDKKIIKSEEEIKFLDKKAEELLIPMLKEAETLMINGAGELFASKHSRNLVKKIAKENPKLRFEILTNGLLFNEKNCEELGIKNRIKSVAISIHSLKEDVYNFIMNGSNLSVVKENIKYAAKLKEKNEIELAKINCVIADYNYKEMPNFVKFAKDLNIEIAFSMLSKWGTEFDKEYEKHAVWEKNNPHYTNFISVLQEIYKINYNKCFTSPLFNNIVQNP